MNGFICLLLKLYSLMNIAKCRRFCIRLSQKLRHFKITRFMIKQFKQFVRLKHLKKLIFLRKLLAYGSRVKFSSFTCVCCLQITVSFSGSPLYTFYFHKWMPAWRWITAHGKDDCTQNQPQSRPHKQRSSWSAVRSLLTSRNETALRADPHFD